MADEARVVRRQAFSGDRVAQRREARKDGWTRAQERTFLEELAATCNVSASARAAGKSSSSVYYHKRHDPGFARGWDEALSVGYAELEAMLLRELLFGSEQEDIMLDGAGAVKARKIRRSHNLAVGLRLFLRHADTVATTRAQEMRDRPDSNDAVARMRMVMEAVRVRRGIAGE